jgi:hypothetical protein
MNNLQLFKSRMKELQRNFRVFPNLETEAKYDYMTQTIMIDSISSDDISLEKIKNESNNETIIKAVSIACHELTHWLDHVSTLWGQNSIVFLANAIAARAEDKEEDFWKIIRFQSHIRRIHYPNYYTTKQNNKRHTLTNGRWMWDLSLGQIFDAHGKINQNKPIIFTRFYDENGFIARVPLSIASLTENNATSEEFEIKIKYSQNLEQNKKTLFVNKTRNDFEDMAYDPDFCVYTVAAHCLSNHVGVTDLYHAYRIASHISILCLNMPKEIFVNYERIKIPKKLQEWNKYKKYTLKESQDRGFLFLILTCNAPEIDINNFDLNQWINQTLKNSGLPTINKLESMATTELQSMPNRIKGDDIDSNYFKELLSTGLENFNKRGILGEKERILDSLLGQGTIKLPEIVLSDGITLNFSKEGEESIKTLIFDENRHDRLFKHSEKIKEFLNACIP